MKTISLSKGQVASVSNEDYQYLSQFRWSAHKDRTTFYAVRTAGVFPFRKQIRMHQVIAQRMGLRIKGKEVDHIDRNGLNNCRENLRSATRAQNAMNRDISKNNTSGFKGVTWSKHHKKWKSTLITKNEHVHIGYFTDVEDAARAYDETAYRYFGTYAKLNFDKE